MAGKHLRHIYRLLRKSYGPQQWWPADTRFEVMVGAILTQNTSWSNVEKAIGNLKSADALAAEHIVAASKQQLGTWLRPSGYFNVKARRLQAFCQWLLEQGGEKKLARWSTRRLRQALLAVHGVGPETADDILLYAFNRPVFVVDAYTRRIMGRYGLIENVPGYEELRTWLEITLGGDVDFYQEYHALIVSHGKHTCRPRPLCGSCCLQGHCAVGKQC